MPGEQTHTNQGGERGMEVSFVRVPITLPCPVPVLPGTPDTMRDGEPIPMEERTEVCAVDAGWMLGRQLLCDIHAREACELLGIDYDDLEAEAGGRFRCEEKPWAERHRYPQAQAKAAQAKVAAPWPEVPDVWS